MEKVSQSLALTPPKRHAVGRQQAAAAEVVNFPGEQIHPLAAARVKVGGIGLAVSVHRHQHPLALHLPLEDELSVGEQDFLIVPIAQGTAAPPGLCHGGNGIGEAVPLGLVEGGAQGLVPLGLLPQDAPLAAVVDAGDARHAEEQAVQHRQMFRIAQNAGCPSDVVVVHEGQQMLAPVQAPGLRAKLPLQAVGDLKEV